MKYFPFLWVVCSFKIPLRPFNMIQTGPKFKEIKAPPRRDFEEASEPYWSINRKANNSSSYSQLITHRESAAWDDRSISAWPTGGGARRRRRRARTSRPKRPAARARCARCTPPSPPASPSIKSATFFQASSSSCMHMHIYTSNDHSCARTAVSSGLNGDGLMAGASEQKRRRWYGIATGIMHAYGPSINQYKETRRMQTGGHAGGFSGGSPEESCHCHAWSDDPRPRDAATLLLLASYQAGRRHTATRHHMADWMIATSWGYDGGYGFYNLSSRRIWH